MCRSYMEVPPVALEDKKLRNAEGKQSVLSMSSRIGVQVTLLGSWRRI